MTNQIDKNKGGAVVPAPDTGTDSRASSPDSLAQLLPEITDGPLSFTEPSSKPPLILPFKPYIFGGVAALTTFAYGFNAGIIAVVLPSLQSQWKLSGESYAFTFIVSSMLAGAVFGSIVPGWIVSDKIGRKPMILFTNGLLILGALGSFFSKGLVSLICSRLIVGLGIGIGSIMPGLYITEMSPASIRGFLGILNQFSGFIGILISYCVGLIFSEEHWQEMFLLAASIPLLVLLCVAFILPESPRWLISHGFNGEALKVLGIIYGRHNGTHSTQEFEKIYAHLSRTQVTTITKSSIPSSILFKIVVLQLIQQAAGSGFVTYYSATIFRSWGLSKWESTLATVLSALPQILVFGAVAKWAEAWGRRRLLLISEAAMVIVLLFLSFVTLLVGPESTFTYWKATLMFIGLAGHRVAYALGLAPVPTVLIAEILPFSSRSHGLALALTLNWFLNFVVTSTIQLFATVNSLSWVYLGMALFSLAAFFFISKNISETRGVVLEANEEMHLFPVMPADPEARQRAFETIRIDSKPLNPPVQVHPAIQSK